MSCKDIKYKNFLTHTPNSESGVFRWKDVMSDHSDALIVHANKNLDELCV